MEYYFTRNFMVKEMACPCCNHCLMDQEFMLALQELRDMVFRPIFINSGFRCPKHNIAVGGYPHSQHLEGRAADIVIDGMSVEEMVDAATKIGVFRRGGIGLYNNFIHIDNRKNYSSAHWDKRVQNNIPPVRWINK